MTPPSLAPQLADRANARYRVHQILTRAHTLWRDITGESVCDRYLKRYAREYAQCPRRHGNAYGSKHDSEHGPMSGYEFWRTRARQVETEINASCC